MLQGVSALTPAADLAANLATENAGASVTEHRKRAVRIFTNTG
jgi:hypothetical protein